MVVAEELRAKAENQFYDLATTTIDKIGVTHMFEDHHSIVVCYCQVLH